MVAALVAENQAIVQTSGKGGTRNDGRTARKNSPPMSWKTAKINKFEIVLLTAQIAWRDCRLPPSTRTGVPLFTTVSWVRFRPITALQPMD